MDRLIGKKAFITGGGGGLGKCIAKMFAGEGARVVVTDRNIDAAVAAAEEINRIKPGAAMALQHDVRSEERWAEALSKAADWMSGISVLVNNAAISGRMANIETEEMAIYRHVMSINLDGAVIGSQLAIPYLKKNQPAAIINMSAYGGVRASSSAFAYSISKAGLTHVTKATALHCADAGYQITANNIVPYFTRTSMIEPLTGKGGDISAGEAELAKLIPMNRLGEPEDIGSMAVFLASDEAKFVTGSDFVVDGGALAQ